MGGTDFLMGKLDPSIWNCLHDLCCRGEGDDFASVGTLILNNLSLILVDIKKVHELRKINFRQVKPI